MANEYKQLKGRIEQYALARAYKKPINADTVEKYIQTELKKGTVTIPELNNMFSEVERDTINIQICDYESTRKRFEVLKKKVILTKHS